MAQYSTTAAGAANAATTTTASSPAAAAAVAAHHLNMSQDPDQQLPPKSSTVNTPQNDDASNPQHKRVYQACIPCRRRKVRCDLGSVDNPHDPPCVRCRRESKECFFSATRRKRKTEDDGSDLEEYVIRNGRRRVQAASPSRYDRRSYAESPAAETQGSSNWRSQPLRRPDGGRRDKRNGEFSDGDANQTLENLEAQTVMRQHVYGPHDALDLLYKAATDRSVTAGMPLPSTSHKTDLCTFGCSPAPTHKRNESSVSNLAASAPHAATSAVRDTLLREIPRQPSASARPAHPMIEAHPPDPTLPTQPGYAEAVRAWSRFRFVRAGWFTAQEAIEYIA
jgi:hypothetical protein